MPRTVATRPLRTIRARPTRLNPNRPCVYEVRDAELCRFLRNLRYSNQLTLLIAPESRVSRSVPLLPLIQEFPEHDEAEEVGDGKEVHDPLGSKHEFL